jgi:parallel beta-helix repeat protein
LIITPSEVQAQHTHHDPIGIEGDEEFASQASDEGWPGDGTEGNPYIIEGYEINASWENGIDISDTTVHFIIRDIRIIYDERWGDNGIFLSHVQNGTVDGCLINAGHSGLHIMSCSNISIINNYIDSKGFGDIRISTSTDFIITDNQMMGTGLDINGNYLKEQDSHYVHNNTLRGKPIYYWIDRMDGLVPFGAGQVYLVNCTNVTVSEQEITKTYVGIGLHYSNNNTIMNNNISFFEGSGIRLIRSDNNTILNNHISQEEYDSAGIDLFISDGNRISGNIISNGTTGIEMAYSAENIIENNTMKENGIDIWGYTDIYYNSHTIDVSNTVNGKPVYYWINRTNESIPSDAGQVIIVECRDMIIENLNISNTTTAIKIGYCSNITIRENILHSNELYGIYIFESEECILVNNDIQDNDWGIRLHYSYTNRIFSNTINDNDYGIKLLNSIDNSIHDNNITNKSEGINIERSYGNIIENNNISGCYQSGIDLRDSLFNDIRNNILFNNGLGIKLWDSDHNNIINNNITGLEWAREGLRFWNSDENLIMENNIFDYEEGIYITGSQGTSILSNNFSNSKTDIEIEGSSNTNISNNIVLDINVINSHEINIMDNIMINSVGIDIEDCFLINISNNLLNRTIEITMKDCNESTIWNNSISYGDIGISIESCNNVLVSENELFDNVMGINFDSVTDSILINNRVLYHGRHGIEIKDSRRNHVIGNIIWKNRFGMKFDRSSDNILHHNQFINNSEQAEQDEDDENTWDDGKGEGNYWDDYLGLDNNGDGVGDTDLPHLGLDNFPLTDLNRKERSDNNGPIVFLIFYFVVLIITIIIVVYIYLKRKPKGGSEGGMEGIMPREL